MTALSVVPVDVVDFDSFWLIVWRREAKKDAQKAWNGLSATQRAECMKGAVLWGPIYRERSTEFRPLPATFIRGERFYDELPDPAKLVNWRATNEGIMAMGRETGLTPRPGEQMGEYAERVGQAVRMRRVG